MTVRRPFRLGWVPLVEPDDHNTFSKALLPDLSVPEERGPINTGLLDANGNALFRTPEPLGFHNPLQ